MKYKISKQTSDTEQSVYIYEDHEKKVPLNSLYSPEKEALRFINKLNNVEKKFVIFIGFGNGTLLDMLVEDGIFDRNVHFLFIEPFSEIKLSDKHFSLISKIEKLSYHNLNNFNSIVFAKFISKFTSIPVDIKIHPNYSKVNQSLIKDCLKIIHEGIETKQILNNTELKFAVDWIVEPLINIEHIPKSVNLKKLQGKFKGERAVLIASGPSLKTHIDFIKKGQDSFHLFAVGSALRALMENEIHPDYVLSVDASDRNYETHFEGIQYKGTLIYETMSNSNIQKHHQGTLVVSQALSDYVTSQIFNDLYSFPQMSPSVAIYTLQVIAYLGFSEVYLVGQDLALVNGEYYAKGIKHHDGMKGLKAELLVENNEGEKVGTTKALKIFLESFESIIKILPKELKIYNLSKQGAKIEGTTYISLNEVSPYSKRMISFNKDTLQLSSSTHSIINNFLDKFDKLRMEVGQASKSLNRMIQSGVVSPDDMIKVVKKFRNITKHEILEEVILSKLTFMFDTIINKFAYFEEKQKYTNDDLLQLVKELSTFYKLISTYIDDILNDERLSKYK
ncbi:motility associated factor glycosyltransferase family protein [Peribacillus asahii]|uniref:motility associated factor glycosyltransferase family protein n=1 Tax=Peribacillus asahii TaxID=228899 RepID=UPI00382F9614